MKMRTIIVICLSALFIGCSNKHQLSDKRLSFYELPIDVRENFERIYSYCPLPVLNGCDTIEYMPPFIEAYNMNGESVDINMSNNIFSNSFTISSNGKRIKLNMNILERVFIIKGDTIYYPISGNGLVTYGKPRSCNVDVDTLIFKASIMN